MSRQTTNYGLTKPDYTDTADIEVINSNMDIVDNTLKVIDTKAQNVMSKNSSAWSSTITYTVGQYCIYNNSLWKCLVQHSGQTPQEGTYWTKVSLDTLGAEISAINQNLLKFRTFKRDGCVQSKEIDYFGLGTHLPGYIAYPISFNSDNPDIFCYDFGRRDSDFIVRTKSFKGSTSVTFAIYLNVVYVPET